MEWVSEMCTWGSRQGECGDPLRQGTQDAGVSVLSTQQGAGAGACHIGGTTLVKRNLCANPHYLIFFKFKFIYSVIV